jgi:hypothetical protein
LIGFKLDDDLLEVAPLLPYDHAHQVSWQLVKIWPQIRISKRGGDFWSSLFLLVSRFADSPGVEIFSVLSLLHGVRTCGLSGLQAWTVRGTVAVVFQSRIELLPRSSFSDFCPADCPRTVADCPRYYRVLQRTVRGTVVDCPQLAVCVVPIRFSPVWFPFRVPFFCVGFLGI